MAIKKLQNDFTTPEQSKRLLELGVPADSADFCYSNFLPCWSVGRLMQIFDLCCDETNRFFGWDDYDGEHNYIDYIISRFIDYTMDFSKLED